MIRREPLQNPLDHLMLLWPHYLPLPPPTLPRNVPSATSWAMNSLNATALSMLEPKLKTESPRLRLRLSLRLRKLPMLLSLLAMLL